MPNRIEENQIKIDWLPSVASYTDLLAIPVSTLKDGDCCEVRDEDIHYTWDSPTQTWKSSLKKVISTISSDTSLTLNATCYVFVDTSVSNVNITLPDATNFKCEIHITKVHSTNKINIYTVSNQTINSYTNLSIMYKNSSVVLVSDGLNWYIT
jgi:hypothetical protein